MAGLCAAPQTADASRLFRYRDERGVMHMETSLPPAYAQVGYEVLDGRTLRVLNVVTPRLTADQLAQQARQRHKVEAAEAEAKKAEQARLREDAQQNNRDRMLLQTYATEADITRLRDDKLEGLDMILRATDNTIGHLRQNLVQMDATLAEHKAAGRASPTPLVNARAKTAIDLASQEQAAARTREEQVALRARFEGDLDRYRRLTGAMVTTADGS